MTISVKLSSSRPRNDGDRNRAAVAQHPDLRLPVRRWAAAAAFDRGKPARHVAQRLVGHAEHIASLIDDDLGRRGHARHQRQIAVIDADHDIVGHDVLNRLRRLADLSHRCLGRPAADTHRP